VTGGRLNSNRGHMVASAAFFSLFRNAFVRVALGPYGVQSLDRPAAGVRISY
jgi:hypothetical protein